MFLSYKRSQVLILKHSFRTLILRDQYYNIVLHKNIYFIVILFYFITTFMIHHVLVELFRISWYLIDIEQH